MTKNNKLKIIAMVLIMCSCIGCSYSNVSLDANEDLQKLSKPEFRDEGTYIIPLKEEFCEEIASDGADSSIYYSIYDKNKKQSSAKLLYKKPIPLNLNVNKITSVNTKEGFEDSDEAVRSYSYSICSPPVRYDGIKTNDLKAGRKNINGSLKFYSILPVYIKVIVKTSNDKKTYTAKVADYNEKSNEKRNWTIALDNNLKKGDKVIVSAYVKDYIVNFTKSGINAMNVSKEIVPDGTWNVIKKTILS